MSTRGSTRSARPHRGHVPAQKASTLVLERRVLMGVTFSCLIGFVLWIIAVSTDYWYMVSSPTETGIYSNSTGAFFINKHAGLWRLCRTIRLNATPTVYNMSCRYMNMFPTREEVGRNPEVDHGLLDFMRTETAFTIISILLMVLGVIFSAYTFKEPRYMFKRLAGGIHFLTAATILVVIEVLINAIAYSAKYLPARHPPQAVASYGFSIYLGWISFGFYIFAGLTFLFCSRKRKNERDVDDLHPMSDAPQILGRS